MDKYGCFEVMATDSRTWYHVTNHDLKPGDTLTPGGGESKWNDYYDREGLQDRKDAHVWVDHDDEMVGYWMAQHQKDPHGAPPNVYEVAPHSEPQSAGEMEGWTTPGARVLRAVDPSRFMDW